MLLIYLGKCSVKIILKAKEENEKLADLILLGMYTGCRIGEVAGMLLEDVHADRFNVVDSKTESGIRSIPIHTDIMQDVERMAQTRTAVSYTHLTLPTIYSV